MLEPQSRRLLLESLHPPAGYRLDWALCTTYSLDLTAILTAPIAFAFSDCQDNEGRPQGNPLALLKAIREYASHICLFCQAGKIHVPATYQPLLAGLEESIVQASAPKGGSFHPKLWILRYIAPDDPVIYRVLCSSRNLTFDRSWDTLLCLEGPLSERSNAFRRNHRLGQFVEDLPAMATRPLSNAWKKRIHAFAHDLRRVEFGVPEPFEDFEFWPLGHPQQRGQPLKEGFDRVLLVSPFVDEPWLTSISERAEKCQLISRRESLDSLPIGVLGTFQDVWVLDDTAEPEPGEVEAAEQDTVPQEASAVPDECPLVGLHAKLYVTESGWEASVWTGSANATGAAFEKNVEFLVRLIGKRKVCGIDTALGLDQPARSAGRLNSLLQRYTPPDELVGPSDEERAFERRVDTLAAHLAACLPSARCVAPTEPDTYGLEVHAGRSVSSAIVTGLTITCRPLSLSASQGVALQWMSPEWARFSISLLGLTSFFAFEVVSHGKEWVRRFVLNIPLVDPPANRSERLLQHLLSDPGRVLQFILLLLTSEDAEHFTSSLLANGSLQENKGVLHGFLGATLLESLLRALDRAPHRIDQVATAIEDLRRSSEGQQLLPPGLDAIWEPVRQVRERQKLAEQKRRDARKP